MSSSDNDSAWAATRIIPDRPPQAPDAWAPTRIIPDRADPPDAWESTRAQTEIATQLLRDKDDYLGGAEARDIGRQTGPAERELFVSCDPGPALEQQFEHLRPEFIAVHDVGTASARKLLASVAAAASVPLQALVIRRQGYGTPLATLQFIDVPAAGGGVMRLFATDCEADTLSRRGIARTLMAFSRLAVLMVGEPSAHVLETAFNGLRDDILAPGWHNRSMLLLPLASSGMVSTFGADLARSTVVAVRTTPLVSRPADAWDFITGTWSRQRDVNAPPLAAPPQRAAPPQAPPLAMRPMPPVPTPADRARAQAAAPTTLLGRYVQRVSELTGVVSCAVFDVGAAQVVAQAGSGTPAAELAQQGTELLATLSAASRSLGFGHAMPEAAVTLGTRHLLLRPVPKHPQLALHAVLDKAQANLTLARLQVARLDAMFAEP